MAPPGFCNRGKVRYESIGGLEYEIPQSRLYCQRGSLLDGLAMYLSCDTKKFHDNESTHILHNSWTSTHRGKLPPSPLAAPLGSSFCWFSKNKCNFLHKNKLDIVRCHNLYHWLPVARTVKQKNVSGSNSSRDGALWGVFFSWGSRHHCPMEVGAYASIGLIAIQTSNQFVKPHTCSVRVPSPTAHPKYGMRPSSLWKLSSVI